MAVPRISVVVPIYNVEEYLETCLDSIAGQTFGDLDVVMVDDGSTDGSRAIAERYAARDHRFRLLTQANGGLSKARNTGIEATSCEFLAFVDSDDVLPPDAYERLLGALDQTGSDFATGNIHRLRRAGPKQSPFAAKIFTRTRLKTHITRFPALVSDRTAWNKLWRRSFWDEHRFRFPEGRVHEDIPVVLPAHYQARSVDVLSEPVYYYRIRESGELSITQRRLEPKVLLDRLSAVETVSRFLAEKGERKARRTYLETVVADDLRYFVNVLESADADYRALFLERVNAFLDDAEDGIYKPLPAIDRLKWHLVRRRLMDELLEVLRFEREDLRSTPPVRLRGKWYGAYPFRTDRKLGIPLSTYRLRQELTLEAGIDAVRLEGSRLEVEGYAYIEGVGAPERGSQRVTLTAARPGALRRFGARLSPVRARASAVHRPDIAASVRRPVSDPTWSGFRASLDLDRLRLTAAGRDGVWQLYVIVRVGALARRRMRFSFDDTRPVGPAEQRSRDGAILRVTRGRKDEIVLERRARWARIRDHRLAGGALELSGELNGAGPSGLALEVSTADGSATRRYAVTAADGGFSASVPVADILKASAPADETSWSLAVVGPSLRLPLGLSPGAPEGAWRRGHRELALIARRDGNAALLVWAGRPLLTDARWTDDGSLEVTGEANGGGAPRELVLQARGLYERHAFPVDPASDGRFAARLTPARVASLAGTLPLREGWWDLYARDDRDGDGALLPVRLSRDVAAQLPLATVVEHKPLALGAGHRRHASIRVERDLDEDERGRLNERRLRSTAYAPARRESLLDAVLYSSYHGRQYSDSPRAIHEELVRREAPLEHLWVVRDGRCAVPPTARVIRDGSREFHEALARSRYVVYNDHFPDWFTRRPDQVCLQTWHGTPLKRLGFDASKQQRTVRRFERKWTDQVANWQYVVSPNRFTTPILRDAYAIEGEMMETGYPRNDMLAGPERDALSRRLRERLGLPQDKRVVLYAPTYRDHVMDRRGRYRLDLRLDLERLRDAVGSDTVILFRKHHYVVDAAPVTTDGFVRDVSGFPDGTELMLAADVLVTDYSSMMFDFANTRRPMLFYTYDLDSYRDQIRGFYFDFTAAAPGPLLRTTDEVADALRGLDDVVSGYDRRYADFVSAFCELDDGYATGRVVDRVFSS